MRQLWIVMVIAVALASSHYIDCKKIEFNEMTMHGKKYSATKEKVPDWDKAYQICHACRYGLASIPEEDVKEYSGKYEAYIASSGSDYVTKDLVWNQTSHHTGIYKDKKPRYAICRKYPHKPHYPYVPTPSPSPTPIPPPVPSPTPDGICSYFEDLTFHDQPFKLSTHKSPDWYTALEICYYCFNYTLGDVKNKVAMTNKTGPYEHHPQVFVGSYDGGLLTPNLVWFRNGGAVAVVDDDKPRKFLCGPLPPPPPPPPPVPSPSPTPTYYHPSPSPTPTYHHPTHYYPKPPTPTPTPTYHHPTYYHPTPSPSPTPIPNPSPVPPPKPSICDKFEHFYYYDQPYWLSEFKAYSWQSAQDICKYCFHTGLGDLGNKVAMTNKTDPYERHPQVFIGSYDDGEITPNLVWFRNAGAVTVVNDDKARKFLCGPEGQPPSPPMPPMPPMPSCPGCD